MAQISTAFTYILHDSTTTGTAKNLRMKIFRSKSLNKYGFNIRNTNTGGHNVIMKNIDYVNNQSTNTFFNNSDLIIANDAVLGGEIFLGEYFLTIRNQAIQASLGLSPI